MESSESAESAQAVPSERAIFITGAASGIGRETALLFAARGWKVGLFDVNAEGLAEAAAGIAEARRLTGVLDVRDVGKYRESVAAFGRFSGGRMDALFNCAGIMRMGPFEQVAIEEHVRTVEINVLGVLHGIHAALGLLKATPGAHILTMGSASGIYGVPDLATYSASKFFIRGLTEALSLELEGEGIVVTDLMPLYVDTPMVRTQSYRAGSLETFGARLTP
ncbi:MAG TPA: SDR family oxidoreductase, partial [Thermoanaerobaculia bacterium]|nr:SDR family oxidoreductase [Thermoanaerobaculia bacterium]